MKNRRLPECVFRFNRIMIMIAVIMAAASAVYACQFWGIVTSSDLNISTYPGYSNNAFWLCPAAQSNGSANGWGMVWNGSNGIQNYHTTAQIWENNGECIDDYVNHVEGPGLPNALNDNSRLVLAHARLGGGGYADPHPFLYTGLLGKMWALQHNGTVSSVGAIEDYIGAPFAALYPFNCRTHTHWVDPNHVNDTEYYTMLTMKNMMIAENTYWDISAHPDLAEIETNVEFAISMTLSRIHDNPTVGSNNAIFACGDTMWLISDRATGDNHRVSSFYGDIDFPWVNMGSTTARTEGAWNTVSNNTLIRLSPYTERTDEINNEMNHNDVNAALKELRINDRDNSVGAQTTPAIATDPIRGTFVTVWATSDGNRIKGRYENQMGMAEVDEFYVDNSTNRVLKQSPAIAISPAGNQMMVVWCEQSLGSTNFTVIMSRLFIWSDLERRWVGQLQMIANTPSERMVVAHPSVALAANGGYAIVWQRTDLSQIPGSSIRWTAFSPGTNIFDTEIEGGRNTHYNPDITNLENATCQYVITWESVTAATQVLLRGVNVFDTRLRMGLPTTLRSYIPITNARLNPCIALYGGGVQSTCVIGFYQTIVRALTIQANPNGTLSILQEITGENPGYPIHPDIAASTGVNGGIHMTYVKPVLNEGLNVFVAKSSGATFQPSVQMNTFLNGDQTLPAIAVARTFGPSPCASYSTLTANDDDRFMQRRMIVWQSTGQDNQIERNWGVVGRIQGINGTTVMDWNESDPVDGITPTTIVYNEDYPDGYSGDFSGVEGEKGNLDEPGEVLGADLNAGVVPDRFCLYPVYPNPFNPTTTVAFDLPNSCDVSVQVYDLTGRLVATVAEGMHNAGSYTVMFDGSGLSTGTYFMRMQAGSYTNMQKLLLIK